MRYLLSLILLLSAQVAWATPDKGRSVEARFGEEAQVRWHAEGETVARLSRIAVPGVGETAEAKARAFLMQHRDLFGLVGEPVLVEMTPFSPQDPELAAMRSTVWRFSPTLQGWPVEGQHVVVRLNAEEEIVSVTSDVVPITLQQTEGGVAAEEGAALIKTRYAIAGMSAPQKVVLALGPIGRVAWRYHVAALPFQGFFTLWVDAETGEILKESRAGFDQILQALPRHGGK